jgi:hypothetical protein
MDRFSKSCLLMIVLLLTIIALHPLLITPTASAAGRYKYALTTATNNIDGIQASLDKWAADGWELVAPLTGERVPFVALIFRKEQ